MKIADIITEKMVMFLKPMGMKETIAKLVDKAYAEGKIKDRDEFEKAILAREEIVSTGIGLGIAIPHAKLKSISEFFVVTAVIREGLDWDSIDRKPVRTVFLIGGPDEKQGEYLKILAKLTLLIKNTDRRERLFMASTEKEVVEVFDKF